MKLRSVESSSRSRLKRTRLNWPTFSGNEPLAPYAPKGQEDSARAFLTPAITFAKKRVAPKRTSD